MTEKFVIGETHKDRLITVLTWFRYFWSGCLTLFATFIVVYGIFAGESSFAVSFDFLPAWFGFILLLIMLGLLLLLEGALVCIVDLNKHTDETFRDKYPRAAKLHSQNSDHESVMSMIIGRQVLVIFAVFIAAQLTAMPGMHNFPFTDKPFPKGFRSVFLEPGVLGGVVTVIFAQLTSQMIATNYPVQFLNMPGLFIVVKLCKVFDIIGIVHVTWLVADLCCRALRLNDEVSIRLKEFDHQLHTAGKVAVHSIPEEPKEIDEDIAKQGKARFGLAEEDREFAPAHAVLCQLVDLFQEHPEYRDTVKSILYQH